MRRRLHSQAPHTVRLWLALRGRSFLQCACMSLRDGLVELVLPTCCVGCQRAGRYWCSRCAATLAQPRVLDLPGLPPLWAAGVYEGPIVRALHSWKEQGSHVLADALAPALAHAVAEVCEPTNAWPASLVPVPTTSAARRRRGEDPLHELTTATASQLRRVARSAAVSDCLTAARARRDQSELDVHGRAINMHHSMRANQAPAGPIVLIDDIVTTGSTLREAVRALGPRVEVIGCAVLAATPKRGRGPESE